MTLERFLDRWSSWRRGLRYALLEASSVRVKFTATLEIRGLPDDEAASDVERALPGWSVYPIEERGYRLVPPPYGGER